MKWPWRRTPNCVDCGWRFGRRGRMHEAGCRVLEAQVDIRERELRRRVAQIEAAKAREARCPSRALTPGGANIWKYCIRVDGHPETEPHIWIEAFTVVSRRPIIMTWEGSFSTAPTISTVLIGVGPVSRRTP
jgi:hypothetical protein